MKCVDLPAKISLTVLLAALVANTLLIIYQRSVLKAITAWDFHGTNTDDPGLQKLPGRFPDVSMVVKENRQYSLIDDEAWAENLPGRRGFVRLGPQGRSFAISLYHQIHCVNAIRFAYTVARDGLATNPTVLKHKIPHDNHCFQFLRQSIQCRADTAVVPLKGRNISLAQAGFGVVHRCRDWVKIRQFVLENGLQWNGVPNLIENGTVESDSG